MKINIDDQKEAIRSNNNTNMMYLTSMKEAPSRSTLERNNTLSTLPEHGCGGKKINDQHQKTRYENKKQSKGAKAFNYNLAGQNFRHLGGEAGKEELVLIMERERIDIVAGQETCQADEMDERWDTGHLFLNFGRDKESTSRAHDGVCFLLNKKMANKFEQGGKQARKYNNRLATIRIPLGKGKFLYVVNVHFPDSSKSKMAKESFNRQYLTALEKAKSNDVMVIMGDFNASMGTNENEEDEVCGEYGPSHRNEAGDKLRVSSSLHQLQDLLTFNPQKYDGTWIHMRSKKWHLLDRVLMRKQDRHRVRKCMIAPMLIDSDHMSTRLHLRFEHEHKQSSTIREETSRRDFDSVFGDKADPILRQNNIDKVLHTFQSSEKGSHYDRLMSAVETVTSTLPLKKPKNVGWCEVNSTELMKAIEERNKACKTYASFKTEETKLALTKCRHSLKKLKKQLKNEWLLEQLQECNESVLPGGKDQKNAYAIWKLAEKMKRGVNKWKGYEFQNIRNQEGVLATTPAENADNFRDFFNDLFDNPHTNSPEARAHFKRMEKREVKRSWREPQLWEVKKVVKDKMNKAAPGLSGKPACLWKALLADESIMLILLKVTQQAWKTKETPSDWRQMYMMVLMKDGDLTLPKNYRGISMAEIFAKLYSHILKSRLEIDYEDIAPEHANGFRKGRSRADSIMAMKETLRKRKASGLDSYAIFWDAIKCFDKIPRRHLWTAMEMCGVSTSMIQAVQSTLLNTTCTLNVGGETRKVDMKEGSGQGTVLGPTLCSFFFLPVLELWCQDKSHCATFLKPVKTNSAKEKELGTNTFINTFADDTGMIAGSLRDVEEVVSQFPTYMQSFGVPVHLANQENTKSKSTVVFVPSNRKDIHKHKGKRININEEEWVNFVPSSRYLGATIHQTLSDDGEIKLRIGKAMGMMGMMRSQIMTSKNVSILIKKKIMLGMILPIMLDGAENWIVTSCMKRHLIASYNYMIRSCFRLNMFTTRKFKITTSSLLTKMDMGDLQYYLDWKVLGYAGHIERMPPNRLPKILRDAETFNKKKIGGQTKSYIRQLSECLKRKGITESNWKDIASNKIAWRKAIKSDSILSIPNRSLRYKERKDICGRPQDLMGQFVEKRFRQTWHVGKITGFEECDISGDIIWNVQYDDGDSEDCDYGEIEKILCKDLAEIM